MKDLSKREQDLIHERQFIISSIHTTIGRIGAVAVRNLSSFQSTLRKKRCDFIFSIPSSPFPKRTLGFLRKSYFKIMYQNDGFFERYSKL